VQAEVLTGVTTFALRELPGAVLLGSMTSPLTGADGNREFLLGLRKTAPSFRV
jgi:23S rRNA (cytidine1920-2'-O)/16S rRNA (cytidine1409-2'-O)-methyltransferase